MKKSLLPLTADDVRYILDDKLRETGLDQVPKRLNLLDKILTSVDKLVGEMKGYREEQALNSDKLSRHDDDLGKHKLLIGRVLKHLRITATS